MSAQLNADLVSFKAALGRLRMSMGADRYRAAQSALAAETRMVSPIATVAQSAQPAAANAPADPHALSAAEQDTVAFLRRSGVVIHGSVAPSDDAEAGDNEDATLAFLRGAGFGAAGSPAGDAPAHPRWHR